MLYCVSEQKKNQVVKHRDKIVKAGFISRPIFPPSSNPPLFPRWPSNTAEAVKISSFFKLQHQFQCFHFTAVSLQLCLSAWSKNADWVRVTKMILVEWEYYIITIIPISQFLLRHSFIAWLWCIDLWFGPIMTDDKIKLIMDFWFRLGAHWGQAVYLTWQEIYVFIWVVCVCVCVCVCVRERQSHFWFLSGWVSESVRKVTLCEISEMQYSFKFSRICWRKKDHIGKKGTVGYGADGYLSFTCSTCIPVGLCVCVSVSEKNRVSIL